MDLEDIKNAVRNERFLFSQHADTERKDEEIDVAQVVEAILSAKVLEQYPDTGRGESCLLVGFSGDKAIHVVCGWRSEQVVIVTVYIPRPPHFTDPWTRGESK